MLADKEIRAFVELLGSDAPAPGGGAAAALAGALGAALSSMVCSLTIGRKSCADFQQIAEDGRREATAQADGFLALMERDAETFGAMGEAFKMPKDTDEQRAARSAAIQSGLSACTAPPFEMMEAAYDALELTKSLVGRTNEQAVSDLGVSALALRAAIQSAWLNVLININSMKDRALADDYRAKGEALLARALPLAEEIYEEVLRRV